MECSISQKENELAGLRGWVEKGPAVALNRYDLTDYACSLLGSLEKLAEGGRLPLLAHLIGLARIEAAWHRSLATD